MNDCVDDEVITPILATGDLHDGGVSPIPPTARGPAWVPDRPPRDLRWLCCLARVADQAARCGFLEAVVLAFLAGITLKAFILLTRIISSMYLLRL